MPLLLNRLLLQLTNILCFTTFNIGCPTSASRISCFHLRSFMCTVHCATTWAKRDAPEAETGWRLSRSKNLPTCCFRFYFGKCFTSLQNWSPVDLPRLCMCCWCHLPDSSVSTKKVQKASMITIPPKRRYSPTYQHETVHIFFLSDKVLPHLICP